MTEVNPASGAPLPSSRRLLTSTLVAAAVAAVLLVTVVLPAEHGIDPTGVGRMLGLTEMGEIKVSLAKEVAEDEQVHAADPLPTAAPPVAVTPTAEVSAPVAPVEAISPAPAAAETAPPLKNDVSEVVLAPNEGKEIKLVMRKDARVTYSWSTDRGVVNFDTHADGKGIKYHGYGKGTGRQADAGVLVAAFDGAHGWFWRNRGTESVTVTLKTTGDYEALKRF